MAINVDVLSSFFKKRIISYVQGSFVITKQESRFSVLSTVINQTSSQLMIVIAQYSAFVEDLETVEWFFYFQEIKESPRKIQ